MPASHIPVGRARHAAEEEGIRFLVRSLPRNYMVFSNVDLPTGRSAQCYEYDAVVISPHAVFAVELKSWGGRIEGNRDRWQLQDGTVVQSPIPLILDKARVLKGQLKARRWELASVWVQGLIFLSAGDADPRITPDFEDLVATRSDLAQALTDPSWLGNRRGLTPQQQREIQLFVSDGKPIALARRAGDFDLLEPLPGEGRSYEVWLGRSRLTGERNVLRVYTEIGDEAAIRERIRTQAMREVTLHQRLYGGPDILRFFGYFSEADPLRFVLRFEDTTPLLPAHTWQKTRQPGLAARMRLCARISRALAFVHEKELVHRRLCPEAVLVSGKDEPEDVRLCAFDLARDLLGVARTITAGTLREAAFRYAAPEVLKGQKAAPASDLFSLGATFFEILTGSPLFQSAEELLSPFLVPPLLVAGQPVLEPVTALVRRLLSPDPNARPRSAEEVAELLEEVLRPQSPAHPAAPPTLRPGLVLRDTYELKKNLGKGATGPVWQATHLQAGGALVLKLAGAEETPMLQREIQVLQEVIHPNLVRYRNLEPYPPGSILVLEYAPGPNAAEWIGAGDPLTPPQLRRASRGLLGAIGALHQKGWLHRDVKPENIILSEEAEPTLLDLGIACREDQEDDLLVGSVRYKDPLLWKEGRWSRANDLYAACLVLYELLCGEHPFGETPPEDKPPTIDPALFPEEFSARSASRLAELFLQNLSPGREGRAPGASSLLAALDEILAEPPEDPAATTAPAPAPRLPETPQAPAHSAAVDSPIEALSLSTRAENVLRRLGVKTSRELSDLDLEALRRLPQVGAKTFRELRDLIEALRARGIGSPAPAPLPRAPFFPPLLDDLRPLSALGKALTRPQHRTLQQRGVATLGDLSALPSDDVPARTGLREARLMRVKEALRRIAGLEEAPAHLAALDERLKQDLSQTQYDISQKLLGLSGAPRSVAQIMDELGCTRQHVYHNADLEILRGPSTVGPWLVQLLEDILPPAGFASLEQTARSLAHRLAPEGFSPEGFARLGAVLLLEEPRAYLAPDLEIVCRSPWRQDVIQKLKKLLASRANWPPIHAAEAEALLWEAVAPMHPALSRWGCDASALLQSVLQLCPAILVSQEGALFTPPVPLAPALAQLRHRLAPVTPWEEACALVEQVFTAFAAPPDLSEDLAKVGFSRDGQTLRDTTRVEPEAPVVEPVLAADIPRQKVSADEVAREERAMEEQAMGNGQWAMGEAVLPIVEALAAARARGGFRVVAMPPALHHRLSTKLHGWLSRVLPPDTVHFLDVDRTLIRLLKEKGLWEFAVERDNPQETWGWAQGFLKKSLSDTLAPFARPGHITILGRPALLGYLGLMSWLSGFYEQARGGRYGLIVLAIPGGVYDNRVRLNEKYNLPYTPDMAAVYLEEVEENPSP